MTKNPEAGGRWIRDPETGAISAPTEAAPPAAPEDPAPAGKAKAPETRKGAK